MEYFFVGHRLHRNRCYTSEGAVSQPPTLLPDLPDVVGQPGESLHQSVAGVGAAALDVPAPASWAKQNSK